MPIQAQFRSHPIVIALLILVFLLGFLGCRNLSDDFKAMDVMSFNIRYGNAKDGENHWEKRRELVFGVFRDHQPDIIGLQEALSFQIEEILEALPQYHFVGIGRDAGGGGELSAILYLKDEYNVIEQETFWLSDTPGTPSASWGNKLVRICTYARLREIASGKSFYVFNTHFDHQSEDSRNRAALLIADRIASRKQPKDPYILMGDFNSGEKTQAIRSLLGNAIPAPHFERAPLVDTFRVLHPAAENTGTFGAWIGKKDGAKIDYVFVAPSTKVLDAAIVWDNLQGRYPSDHFPVKAKLQF